MTDASMQVRAVAAPVRQQVFETIREAIISGRFPSGQRLVEKDLCELMGVSRPSVREALRQLESEGLVRTVPNKGPVVASLTKKEAVGIYQVRGALEALAAELCARNASDSQIETLKRSFEDLKRAIVRNNVQDTLKAKDVFYATLFAAADNETISQILRTMNARITFLRRVSLSSKERWPSTLAEIDAVVEAISDRKPDKARELMRKHVMAAAEVALASIGNQQSDPV